VIVLSVRLYSGIGDVDTEGVGLLVRAAVALADTLGVHEVVLALLLVGLFDDVRLAEAGACKRRRAATWRWAPAASESRCKRCATPPSAPAGCTAAAAACGHEVAGAGVCELRGATSAVLLGGGAGAQRRHAP